MPRETKREIPGQLPMFMTPREITEKYQVLDADRREVGGTNDFDNSHRLWERTDRPEMTGGHPNIHDPGTTGGSRRYNWAQGTGDYVREPREETDEEVLSRKNEEAQLHPDDYREVHQAIGASGSQPNWESLAEHASYPKVDTSPGRDPISAEHSFIDREEMHLQDKLHEHEQRNWDKPSIWESVREEGVQSPVHLGAQFGSQGKPQIVGGHHRIAAALDVRPDDLIPVLHHEDIFSARDESVAKAGYKYT